ncbi:homer protein homolog 2-like isoform X1 [Anneissia japonica]|uniref:homer protein homolog 2-like isoform X1 n=1 Tax=Anneissia japonica TaxID=1529436 RepID=UPI0014254EB6|nr:homer protein homolog 2-like isoform X1 [Anneissia japonica]
MGEQPIFTTRAHVFRIDPVSKKNWLPSSKQAVNISYFYDNTKNIYRIISVDGSKAIINSTINPSMSFTKTSQKFGQWSDSKASTVYGLGFSTEAELNKFVEKFNEVKEATKGGPSEKGSGDLPNIVNSHVHHDRSGSGSSNDSSNVVMVTSAAKDSQLKYENDRLKIALAQSSANAKKWELELQTLKNNNARLTTALQESTANVEEWKKQLSAYKEENARLKKRTSDLESGHGESSLLQDKSDLQQQLQALSIAHKTKEKETHELHLRLQSATNNQMEQSQLRIMLQNSDSQVGELESQVSSLMQELEEEREKNRQKSQQLASLHAKLAGVIQQASTLNQTLGEQL